MSFYGFVCLTTRVLDGCPQRAHSKEPTVVLRRGRILQREHVGEKKNAASLSAPLSRHSEIRRGIPKHQLGATSNKTDNKTKSTPRRRPRASMQVVGRPWIFWSHVLLRFLQFAFSLIALITLSAAFVSTSYYGYGSMLGSSATTYVTIVTYTAFVYALWFLIVIFILRMCGRPPLFYEQLMDFLLAVMLLVAAIVLVCSDYVQNCSVYVNMLRCNSIKAAVVFTFLAFASFVMTLLLSFCEYGKHDAVDEEETRRTADVERGSEGPAPAPYHQGSTPTARGNPPYSASRV